MLMFFTMNKKAHANNYMAVNIYRQIVDTYIDRHKCISGNDILRCLGEGSRRAAYSIANVKEKEKAIKELDKWIATRNPRTRRLLSRYDNK